MMHHVNRFSRAESSFELLLAIRTCGCCHSSNAVAHLSGPERLEALLGKDAHGNWLRSSLESINLSGLKISDEHLLWIVEYFPELTSLNLSGQRRITSRQAKSLARLTRLQSLDLSYTLLNAKVEQFLMDANPKLLITRKDYTQVTDAGLQHLAGLTSLTSLNLYNTQVTDAGPQHLAGLKSLTSLNLSYTKVTVAGIRNLRILNQLEELWFQGTFFNPLQIQQLIASE